MSHFRNLLKRAGVTPDQLSEATGLSIRTVTHHYSTGRMPYIVLYKMSRALGIPINEMVTDTLAEYWNSLWDEGEEIKQPRGRKKGWRKGDTSPLKRASGYKKIKVEDKIDNGGTWSKNLELDAPVHGQEPEEKIHVEHIVKHIPESVTPPLPESVTPQKQKKSSIADLMKASPPPAPPSGEPEPDFSNIPDEVFSTSMDAGQNPASRRRK